MLSVEEALARILAGVPPLPATPLAIARAGQRYTCASVSALTTHPPCDVSAMDGYAVRAQDTAQVPAVLNVVGEAPAGGAYGSRIAFGEAVRIFTGGPLPEGADAVVIQEDTRALGDGKIEVHEAARPGAHVRRKGGDFTHGDLIIEAGRRLNAPAIALAAAAGHAILDVAPRPRVAILATGDELVPPGTPPGPFKIIASNGLGLAALITAAGGEPVDLGIAPDDPQAIAKAALSAPDVDVFVTTGGASVGDRDFVQGALAAAGLDVAFWKIAMKPGKPLIFGSFRGKPFFGLPGNPVSALVCALLYLRPALLRMQGRDPMPPRIEVILGHSLAAGGTRQEYLRARLEKGPGKALIAHVFPVQDSAALKTLALSDALLIRPPQAPRAEAGETVDAIPLADLW